MFCFALFGGGFFWWLFVCSVFGFLFCFGGSGWMLGKALTWRAVQPGRRSHRSDGDAVLGELQDLAGQIQG